MIDFVSVLKGGWVGIHPPPPILPKIAGHERVKLQTENGHLQIQFKGGVGIDPSPPVLMVPKIAGPERVKLQTENVYLQKEPVKKKK